MAFRRLRSKVSQDRVRHVEDGVDLDLTYITPNIIAMGFPASGVESAWRNHIDTVAKFLKSKHQDAYMVWNLSERDYSYDKFEHQIMEFGFPDHHSPPLDVLFKIILSMDNWLRACESNVSVVHCMGGKGRTGTVIACYLLYCGQFADPQDSLQFFADKRSKIGKGVIQPSQLRYVRYFHEILNRGVKPHPQRLCVDQVTMSPIPRFSKRRLGCKPRMKIYSVAELPRRKLYESGSKDSVEFVPSEDGIVVWKPRCLVRGDVLIKCSHYGNHHTRAMWSTTFHTAFVQPGQDIELDKPQLDAIPKGEKHANRYDPDFRVTIRFVGVDLNGGVGLAGSNDDATDASILKGRGGAGSGRGGEGEGGGGGGGSSSVGGAGDVASSGHTRSRSLSHHVTDQYTKTFANMRTQPMELRASGYCAEDEDDGTPPSSGVSRSSASPASSPASASPSVSSTAAAPIVLQQSKRSQSPVLPRNRRHEPGRQSLSPGSSLLCRPHTTGHSSYRSTTGSVSTRPTRSGASSQMGSVGSAIIGRKRGGHRRGQSPELPHRRTPASTTTDGATVGDDAGADPKA